MLNLVKCCLILVNSLPTAPLAMHQAIFHAILQDNCLFFVFLVESTNYTFVDEQAIFANNELGMRHIEVYGFDYDYTLASYSNTLHYLIYDLAVKELISTYGVKILSMG